jgi:hypothetical protein
MLKDTFEDYRKGNQQTILDLNRRVKELETKTDFAPFFERTSARLKALEDNLAELKLDVVRDCFIYECVCVFCGL